MLNRVLIYCRNPKKMAEFYVRHFHFETMPDEDERIIELRPTTGGAILMLHQAAKS